MFWEPVQSEKLLCLMKFGCLPPAADPDHPTAGETSATRAKVADYQPVPDTHRG